LTDRGPTLLATHRLAHRIGQVGEVIVPLLIGLAVTAVVIAIDGKNPFGLIAEALYGTLFSRIGLLQTLATATALALTAQTFALGVSCGVFNIGAEGAVFVGAGATLAVGAFATLPPGLHHATTMAAGALRLIRSQFLERNAMSTMSTR